MQQLRKKWMSQNKNTEHQQDILSGNMLPEESNAETSGPMCVCLQKDQVHMVWKPDIRDRWQRDEKDINERRKNLLNRVWATQQVLKLQGEDAEGGKVKRKKGWLMAITKGCNKRVKAEEKKLRKRNSFFHDVVSQYESAMSPSSHDDSSTATQAKAEACRALRQWRSQYMENPGHDLLSSQATVVEHDLIEDTATCHDTKHII